MRYLSGMRLITLLLLTLLCTCARAQKVLIFEQLTSSKADRVYEGETLKFRLKGDKFWQEGYIREMRPDIQALVINDRFIMLDEIDVIHQGSTAAAAAGYSLMAFGVGWSAFGLVGYNTDGDPSTQYSNRDFLTTATSVGVGFVVFKLFGQKKYRTGKYKRLRVIDTSF
jgi:hypothetical protein